MSHLVLCAFSVLIFSSSLLAEGPDYDSMGTVGDTIETTSSHSGYWQSLNGVNQFKPKNFTPNGTFTKEYCEEWAYLEGWTLDESKIPCQKAVDLDLHSYCPFHLYGRATSIYLIDGIGLCLKYTKEALDCAVGRWNGKVGGFITAGHHAYFEDELEECAKEFPNSYDFNARDAENEERIEP